LKKKKEKQEEDIEKFTKRVLENIDKIEKILTLDPEVKEKAKKIKKNSLRSESFQDNDSWIEKKKFTENRRSQ